MASSPPLPAIGVGTWAWGNQFLWGYRSDSDTELEATFQRAVALGFRFFDTADSYGTGRLQGRSEALLGRFAAALPPERRDALCLATKLAPFPWRLGRRGFDRALAASRDRLGGRLDRVQLHWSTARYAPWQEGPLLAGLADQLLAGAVRELGVSNLGPRRLRAVHGLLAERGVALCSVQVQASLLAPEALLAPAGAAAGREPIAAVCRELGIELIGYSSLALGLLAQPPGPSPPPVAGPRAWLYRRLWPGVQPLLTALAALAAQHRSSQVAVALNWCRAHGALPLVGLRRPSQAETAASALDWQLEEGERQALDQLALACPVRMPANPFQSA